MGRQITSNPNVYSFRLQERKTCDLVWDRMGYYDLETGNLEQMQVLGGERKKNDPFADLLDIRTVGITSFCLALPIVLGKTKQPCILWRPSLKKLCESKGVRAIEKNVEGANFIFLSRYIDIINGMEDRIGCFKILEAIIHDVAKNLKKHDKTLMIAGFNNAKFDDLIFDGALDEERMLHRLNILNEEGEWEKSKIIFYDLLPWAKSYGLAGGLKRVGKWVGLKKLKKDFSTVEGMLEYNERDVEILPLFAKKINEIHASMDADCLNAYTPAGGSRYYVSRALKNYVERRYNNGAPFTRKKYPKKQRPKNEDETVSHYHGFAKYIADCEAGETRSFVEWLGDEEYTPVIESSVNATRHFTLYGGRTEAYHALAKNPYYGDVNSLYPSVQCQMLFPKIEKWGDNFRIVEEPQTLEISDKNQYMISPETHKPVLNYNAIYRLQKRERRPYISPIARATYKTMEETITPYWYKVATGKGWETVTPQKVREIVEPLFLSGDGKSAGLFYGTCHVRIDGIKKIFIDLGLEKTIKRYFPFPRKVDGFTCYSLAEGEIYEVQFYEIAFLGLFDFQFICWTDEDGYVDQDRLAIGYQPDVYPVKEDLELLYAERQKFKQISEDETLPKQERDVADSMQLGKKLILNAGYGILATRNFGRTSKVFSDKGKIELGEQAKEAEIRMLDYDRLRDDFLSEEELETLDYQWRSNGTPSVFHTFDPVRQCDVRVRSVRYDEDGEPAYYIVEDITDEARYAKNSIPIWGICTTSCARFVLNSLLLNAALVPAYRAYYTDTDSLIMCERLYKALEKENFFGKNLGQMKLEKVHKDGRTKISDLCALASKSYILVLDDGSILPTMKGTKYDRVRTINSQGLGRPYVSFDRHCIKPENLQKRKLVKETCIEYDEATDSNVEKTYLVYESIPFEPGTKLFKDFVARCLPLLDEAKRQEDERAAERQRKEEEAGAE